MDMSEHSDDRRVVLGNLARSVQFRDENIDYYIAKLDDLVKKFSGTTADASSAKQASLAL